MITGNSHRSLPHFTHPGDKDPNFPSWNGEAATVLLWLYKIDEISKAEKLPDEVAIRYTRLAMGTPAYAYFDEFKPKTWSVVMLKRHFLPVDIETMLLTELFELKMYNNDFHTYYTTLNVYRRHLAVADEQSLSAAFNQGLEPHLHHAVVTARPTALADANKFAQEIQSHPPPRGCRTCKQYQQVQAEMHGQLEQFSQQAGQFIQ